MNSILYKGIAGLLIIILYSYKSQSQITFEKSFDTLGCYYGNTIKQTIDSGFILCGSNYSSAYMQNAAIIKTDKFGSIEWVKSYGGNTTDGANTIEIVNDTNYLIAGFRDGYTATDGKIFILFLNSRGDTIWTKAFKIGSGFSRIIRSIKTQDGGFAFTGYISLTQTTPAHSFILKMNNLGDTLWSKLYSPFAIDQGLNLFENSDKTIILIGLGGDSINSSDIFAIKTDSLGDQIWIKTYSIFGPSNIESANSICKIGDGGFIISGYAFNAPMNNYDAYLIKIDSAGTFQWNKLIGDLYENGSYNLQLLSDGNMIFTGLTATANSSYDIWVEKIDTGGNLIWNKTFGGINSDIGYYIQQTSDKGFIIIGTSDSFNPNSIYMIKIDSLGSLFNYTYDIKQENIGIYPNPANSYVEVKFDISVINNNYVKYDIIDLTGKIYSSNSITSGNEFIRVDNLKNGIYFIKFIIRNNIYVCKLIIQH